MKNNCILCAKCCEQTEMLLTNEDVERIIKQNRRKSKRFTRQKFAYLRDGYLYLKNEENHCVFLNNKTRRCSIYQIRPMGCRFYPIIYDPFTRECIIDGDCSNKENFPQNQLENICPALENFILRIEQERKDRLIRVKALE